MPPIHRKPGAPPTLAKLVREMTDLHEVIDMVTRIRQGKPILVGGTGKDRADGYHVIPTLKDIQWALDWVANRGYGMPTTHVEFTDVTESSDIDVTKMTREKRDQLEALLAEYTGDVKQPTEH